MKTTLLKLSLQLFFLFLACSASAHTGSIKGYVSDASTGKPLEAVSIQVAELSKATTTDAFGAFFLAGIPAGRYTVTIQFTGFTSITEAIKVEDGITTDLSYSLRRGQIQLSDVTVSAAKDVSHSSISGLDLKLRPVNTTQDMLRLVPGLFISQHQGGGKAEQMFLRGFDVDHGTDVAVSVDGIPVNMVSHAHGQGYADLHWVIPELVEQMNFGKGPYAIDKGNLATAGWVDFKTTSYLDNSFVKLEGGMYDYYRAVAAINLIGQRGVARHDGAYIAGEYSYNRGYFDRSQNFNRFNLVGKYTRQLSKDKLFTVTATGFHTSWDASGQIPTRAVASGLIGRFGEIDPEGGATSRYNLNLQYTQAINRNTSFRTNLYVSYYDFELYSNFTFYLNDSVNGDEIRQREPGRLLYGYNASYSTRYKIGSLETKTEAGIGFRHDDVQNSELSHTVDRMTLQQIRLGDIHETNIYGFVNQAFYLLPGLVANAGTRFDYFVQDYKDRLVQDAPITSVNLHAFSPKAGLYYNLGHDGRLYFNYGIGFHTNDTRAVTDNRGNDVLPLAHSADLGIIIKPFPKLLLQAALYNLDLDVEYTYPGDNGGAPEASGRTRRYGADLSARYQVLPSLYFDIDANYSHGRYRDEPTDNNLIPLAPVFTSIGGLTFRNSSPWSASLRYRYMADRPAETDNSVTAPGYAIFDLTAAYSRKHYELGIQIQNLTNTQWNEAAFNTETRLRTDPIPVTELCFTPGTPFFLKFSATYKF